MEKNKIISYDDFLEKAVCEMRKHLGRGCLFETRQVVKNNGFTYDTIMIRREGDVVVPSVYINPFYEAYRKEGDFKKTVEDMVRVYFSALEEEKSSSAGKIVFEYEVMKNKIIYRLVNYKKNQEILKKMIYDRFLDLAVTYYCLVECDDSRVRMIQITKQHLKEWKIDQKTIKEDAFYNTPVLFPANIRSMMSVMQDILKDGICGTIEELSEDELKNGLNLYILTNLQGINGATCLLYPDLLKEFHQRLGKDFYILPSSIHELILAPARMDFVKEEMDFMVQDINMSQVAPEEVLSENAYLYSVIKEELGSLVTHR